MKSHYGYTQCDSGKCTVMNGGMTSAESSSMNWWSAALNLDIRHQHDSKTNPLDDEFDYAEEFIQLDQVSVKQDLLALMIDSQSLVLI